VANSASLADVAAFGHVVAVVVAVAVTVDAPFCQVVVQLLADVVSVSCAAVATEAHAFVSHEDPFWETDDVREADGGVGESENGLTWKFVDGAEGETVEGLRVELKFAL